MTDFSERLNLYKEGNMLDDNDIKDIKAIIKMFKDYYHIELTEENASVFITHICSAYNRNKTNYLLDELPKEVKEELLHLETYAESLNMLDRIIDITSNYLNQTEKDYMLLHINNLIRYFKENNEWVSK